jgi:plastocyanin
MGFAASYTLASPPSQGNQITVTMKDFEFDPKTVTINVGDSIVWTNAATKKHTATADDNAFDTGVVAPGASSQPIKFDKPGTFPYFCQFHGGPGGVDMAGVVTVLGGASTTQATPVPPAASVGQLTFADKAKNARADSITLTLTSLPLPGEGQQYEAWLGADKTTLSLGKINLKADGTATLTYSDPKGANLINAFNTVLITVQGNDLTPAGPVVFSGNIPPQADVHIKHVVSQFPDTPDKVGLLIGALDQEAVLTQHVGFMNDALKKGNIAGVKLHLEHIHNIMTGTDGAKDLDGNGKIEVTPPSDGFGIFNYLTTAAQHADLAAKQPDATNAIKVKASHVRITVANASTTLTQIQTLVLEAAGKKSLAEIKPLADQISALNLSVTQGIPDATGAITPTKGSGGLTTAYAEGLGMATMLITPGDVTGGQGSVPPAATVESTPTGASHDETVNATTITMKDFEFDPKTVTITVGSSVIFSNQGAKKHTATADDNAFDTGVIAPGSSSQPIKFDKPGTFLYYCQFHGGPGETAMAGTIVVK